MASFSFFLTLSSSLLLLLLFSPEVVENTDLKTVGWQDACCADDDDDEKGKTATNEDMGRTECDTMNSCDDAAGVALMEVAAAVVV